jgi:hypothetical protein
MTGNLETMKSRGGKVVMLGEREAMWKTIKKRTSAEVPARNLHEFVALAK